MTQQDDSWLAELRSRPSAEEVAPGLTVATLMEFHARPPTPPGTRFEPDVVYATVGPDARPLHLDVYRRPDDPGPRPGIIFVHGGGWKTGHRYSHIRRACLLAAHGWVAATISYRLSSEAGWPAPLDDVRAAISWMRANASWLGLDAGRLVVAGDSAGAHLATMAGLQAPSGVAALALWYPVTDLASVPGLDADVTSLMGTNRRRRLAAASPVSHVGPGAPPVVSFAGEEDAVVPLATVSRFHELLSAADIDNELHVYRGVGHAFDFVPDLWQDSFDKCRRFLDRVVGSAEPTLHPHPPS